jgi:hypothetical protein
VRCGTTRGVECLSMARRQLEIPLHGIQWIDGTPGHMGNAPLCLNDSARRIGGVFSTGAFDGFESNSRAFVRVSPSATFS